LDLVVVSFRHELLQRFGLFDRRQILPEDVLHERNLLVIGAFDINRRDGGKPRSPGGRDPAFSGNDEKIPALVPAEEDRFQNPVFANGISQFRQCPRGHEGPGLVGVGLEGTNIDFIDSASGVDPRHLPVPPLEKPCIGWLNFWDGQPSGADVDLLIQILRF